ARSGRRGGPCRADERRPGAARSGRTSAASDRDQLAVDAEGGPEAVADLADRRMGLDGVDHRAEDVLLAAGRLLESVQRGAPGGSVTLRSNPPDALDLAALPFRVDSLERRTRLAGFVVPKAVDSDDDEVAPLDRLLNAIGGLLDLTLLEPALD